MKNLNKSIFVFCMITFLHHTIHAQSIGGGIRIGANIAKVTGKVPNTEEALKIMPGGHFGFFFRAGAASYRFQAEALVSTGGSKVEIGNNHNVKNISINLDMPLLFNYKFVKVLYAEAGVQPSFLLTNYNFGEIDNRTIDTFSTEGLRKVNFAPLLGFGVDLKKVTIGLRFVYSLTSMNDKETLDNIKASSEELYKEYKKQKLTQTMLTFGFKF